MRKKFLLLFYILTHILPQSKGQSNDSGVEIRLKIIQGFTGDTIKNLVLGISVINHTDRDIYIPDFRYVGYYHGIHLAQKENGSFTETDLLGQNNNGPDVMFTYTGNTLTKALQEQYKFEVQSQDSLLKIFHGHYIQPEINRLTDEPLFLKAKQQLNEFRVFNMEHILKESNEYKIYFYPSNDKNKWPSQFIGYSLYPQDAVVANTIYLSSYKLDQ